MNSIFIRRLFYFFSRPFSIQLLQFLTNQYIIFPFYHTVSDNPSPLIKHLYPVVSVDRFKKDLEFLLKYYEPATCDEALHFASTKVYRGKPRFFLSFDDGFSECYTVIMPILKEKGLQAAFFINPAFVGNHQMSHRQKISLIIDAIDNNEIPSRDREAGKLLSHSGSKQKDIITTLKKCSILESNLINSIAKIYHVDFNEALLKYKPYMNINQLRELQANGNVLGSHSYNHPEFSILSMNEMKEQVDKSFSFLESETDIKNRIFSFPFHDIGVSRSFFKILQEEAGVKASFGTSGLKHDDAPGHLHRIPMEVNQFHDAESIIRMEYFYYLVKMLFGKNTIVRR